MIKEFRKTRLHDEKGNLISFKRFLKNGIKALYSYIILRILNKRPVIPWISYDAIKFLRNYLSKDDKVLEFGSGMSTLWLSKHAGEVYSVEDNPEWYKILTECIEKENIKNIHLEHRIKNEFCYFPNELNEKFDLILVDGSNRGDCMQNAIDNIAIDGIIYLDNSDKGLHDLDKRNEYRIAEELLLDYARIQEADVIYFTDFAPTSMFVQQGLMVIINKKI